MMCEEIWGGWGGGKNCLPLFGICSHGLKEVRGVGTPNPSDSVLFLKDCREARGK